MEYDPKVRMDLLTSKEVSAYLKTNDMVILPVGCMEMHGPQIPLGCDTHEDHAVAIMLAEKWKCITALPIPYVFPGASEGWPGTVSISPEISTEYIKQVILSLIAGGFKRVVILGSHGPMGFMGQTVIRSIYRETQNVVIHLAPYWEITKDLEKEFGFGGEQLMILGAMKYLGWHGMFDPTAEVDKDMEYPFQTIAEFGKAGIKAPWKFNRDYQHTGIKPGLTLDDADRVLATMKKTIDERMADVPENFKKYQEEMADLDANPPWKDDGCWTI